jgi:hypothetical protein
MRVHMLLRLIPNLFLIYMLTSVSFSVALVEEQNQTPATVATYREPFKDFFDYEWWLPGSEYFGLGAQYGKWTVIEMFPDNPHDFRISSDNPISGTDSAVLDINGSRQGSLCETWVDLSASQDPDHLVHPDIFMSPTYMRFSFRIDRWDATNSYWRVTLGELAGNEHSALITQVIIALEGFAPPHLWMLYKTGSSASDWDLPENKHELVSSTTVSLDVIHSIELYRYADSVDGEVRVWLDGNEVADLTVQNVDTSYPGGVRSVRIGSSAYYTKLSPGSWATITFDDIRVRDQYMGETPLPITYYDLTLDSSPQGKIVRVGNHIAGTTPVTIKVPEGTVPKVGIDPLNFDHWEIDGNYTDEHKELFGNYSEIWPNVTPSLIATVTRAPASEGPGVLPTPPIYSDTRITAIYTTSIKHTVSITSNPVATSFTVDELDYTTPWSDSLTEGTHTISVPSTFTIGDKRYDFRNWEDYSTNPTRTLDLVNDMHITAYYDVTIIPEFPTLIAWLAVIAAATLLILLWTRKLNVRSRYHRD